MIIPYNQVVVVFSTFQFHIYMLKLSNNLNKKFGINMKIVQNQTPKVSFKGIVCPNKYFDYLNSCTKEVTKHCEEVIVIPAKSDLSAKNGSFVQFIKNLLRIKQQPFQVVSQKNPYNNIASQFLEDPLRRMSKDGTYDYNVTNYSIYKFDEEIGRSKPAIEEEHKVFDMLKKQISAISTFKDGDLLSDEILLKKHGIAFIDNNNALRVKKTLSENIDFIV